MPNPQPAPPASPDSRPDPDPADAQRQREKVLARQARRESSARTYARWLDIVPVRASGARVVGSDGRSYLDCLAGAGTLALGHNHPEVTEAVARALGSGAPLHILDVATPEKDAFVTELFQSLPGEFLARSPRIQFCGPAGTDAVEAAIKLCQIATGRRGIAAFSGGYHGMSLTALDASGHSPHRGVLSGAGGPVAHLPYPYPLHCPFGLGDADGEVAARYLERLLADPCSGVDPPALLLLEVVQGEGGVIPAPHGWLRAVARIARRHDIPLVVDEVQTGVGRTGTFWAHEQAEIVPDVIVTSKAVGGGLPLAAILYAAHLDAWPPGAHAGTFRGNVLAMVAGTTTLRIVRRDGLAARAARLGRRMLVELRVGLAGMPCVAEVRGRGLMIGIEFGWPSDAGRPDEPPLAAPEVALDVRRRCLERGLIAELGGRHGAVLRLLPPLVLSDADAALAVEIVCESVAASMSAGVAS